MDVQQSRSLRQSRREGRERGCLINDCIQGFFFFLMVSGFDSCSNTLCKDRHVCGDKWSLKINLKSLSDNFLKLENREQNYEL